MNQVICPECGEGYSPQGLYGHLMGHGLGGEDLEEVYQEAMSGGDSDEREEEFSGSLTELGDGADSSEVEESGGEKGEHLTELPDPPSQERGREERQPSQTTADEVQRAADQLRRAKARLNTVMDELGVQELDGDDEGRSGGAVTEAFRSFFGSDDSEGPDLTVAERECLEQCREEVNEARRELRRLLQKREAEHEYGG